MPTVEGTPSCKTCGQPNEEDPINHSPLCRPLQGLCLACYERAEERERWRPVPGFLGVYEVSDLGRFKSLPRRVRFVHHKSGERTRMTRGVVRKLSLRGRYPGVGLAVVVHGRRIKSAYLRSHIAVLNVFVGPRPEGYVARHWDDDPLNNSVENLRWGTQAENMADMIRNRGHHRGTAKLAWKAVSEIRSSGEPNNALARRMGVSERTIRDVKQGRTWRARVSGPAISPHEAEEALRHPLATREKE